jgi:transposase
MQQRIERVDEIPLLLHWLAEMGVQEKIDSLWKAHGNWEGLSYGQLAQLFLTYVLHSLNHSLYKMEPWLADHQTLIEQITGWQFTSKDATDDRLATLIQALGTDDSVRIEFQTDMGQHLIQAYALPTDVARYDTTSFSVHHARSAQDPDGLLRFGHSKDHRPDLLQFKQGLGTLDPAGIPLYSNTLSGNTADDNCYVPAWRELARTIGHADFLYVADCKAAALSTRATIDQEKGRYLFPLPMTGEVPEKLRQLVMNPPEEPSLIHLTKIEKGKETVKEIGRGFATQETLTFQPESNDSHTWVEQWFVVQSHTFANIPKKAILTRIENAGADLQRLKPKKDDTAEQFRQRAEKILKNRKCEGLITVEVQETLTFKEKCLGRGRPKRDSPRSVVEAREISVQFQRNPTAIDEALTLAGWRIYVTNVPACDMSLEQSVRYYREEWLVERGFHRFKQGSLPVLPLYVRLHERIKGLMLLLTIALQAITLIEFVARRNLAATRRTISGLVPGNPRMKTDRPTTERLLAQFEGLHLLIEQTPNRIKLRLVEELNPLQIEILALLNIPPTIYNLSTPKPKFEDSS